MCKSHLAIKFSLLETISDLECHGWSSFAYHDMDIFFQIKKYKKKLIFIIDGNFSKNLWRYKESTPWCIYIYVIYKC